MKNYIYDGSRKFSSAKFDTKDTGGLGKEEAIKLMNENLPKIDELQKKPIPNFLRLLRKWQSILTR